MGLFFIAYQTDVACSRRNFLRFPVTVAGCTASCSVLCRAAHECQGGERICLGNRKGITVLLSVAGHGVAVISKWKNANKYRTDADKFQLLWKQLDAVERASDLEARRPGLKSQVRHSQAS